MWQLHLPHHHPPPLLQGARLLHLILVPPLGARAAGRAQGSSPFVSCAPPPSDRTIARIKRGKYIDFANLLPKYR